MSSVGVFEKKSKCFVRKKSKCPKKNFQSVKKGGKSVSVEFRVFGKKMKEKFRKKIKVFWKKFEVKDFAKFVFTVGFFVV